MEKIKQHNMIKMDEGEVHPIFSLEYMPENITSFFETIVFFVEYSLMLIFFLDIFINLFSKYTFNFVPTIMINAISAEFFMQYGIKNNLYSNIFALLGVTIVYIISRKYFEFVKYNLHPKKAVSTKKTNKKIAYK